MIKNRRIILVTLILLMTLTACAGADLSPESATATVPFPTATPSPKPTLAPTPTPTLAPPPEHQVTEGEYALFVGDYAAARQIFEAVIPQSEDESVNAKSNLGLGQVFYKIGNFSAAMNRLQSAAAAPDPIIAARANYQLAQVYTTLQRYDDALLAYETYLQLQPGLIDSHVHELRGDLFKTVGDNDSAITSFRDAYRTDPNGGNENLAVKIAVAYHDSGDQETALSLYKDIYNTSENNYTKAEMGLRIGRIYLAFEESDQAYVFFKEIIRDFPYAYDAFIALETLLNAEISVDNYDIGMVNYYVGNYSRAIEAFTLYLADAPEEFGDSALYHYALSTRSLGADRGEPLNEEAIALWEEMIENYPLSPLYNDAWRSIEFTYSGFMGDPQMAAQTAIDFVAQRPEAPEAPDFLFRAGRAYERGGMLREAANTWARIANEYPGADETFRGTYFAGISLVRLADWAGAQALFSRALVLTNEPSEIAAAHLWIGKCYQAKGDMSAALESWKQSQVANPFGHYSIRAEDLLIGRDPFTEPVSFDLDPDLSPYKQAAEVWLRTTFDLPLETNLESPGLLAYDPRYKRGHEFWALGDYEAGKREFESMRIEFAQDPEQTFRLIPAMVEIGLYRSALEATSQLLRLAGLVGGEALDAPEYFSRIRFGAYYLDWLLPAAEEENISPLMMLSVIRRESAYEGFARSGAGARGLMQVMPGTGEELAGQLGWPENYSAADLNRPNVSLAFGAAYLKQWRTYFEGDIFAMLAAYNGGPGNTIGWKNLTPSDDPDLFLEIVHLEETRIYIRIINEIHYIYRWLYGTPMEP